MAIKELTEKIRNQKWYSIYLVELLALIFLFLLGSLTIDGFFSTRTILSTILLSSFLAIAAGGQTVVTLLGAIDLAIPAYIGSAAFMIGFLTGKDWPFYTILLVLIAGAIIFGIINGYVSKKFNIHPMITTLAIGAILEGLTYVITKGIVLTNGPMWLNKLSALNVHMGFIPLPPIVGIWAFYSVVTLLLLYKTTWGKRLYAAGVNDRAAQLALVNTTWVWISAFVFSALSAVLAGILLAGFAGSSFFDIGKPYLFMTVGAVVLGGTSTLGGRGGYGRTIFGVLIMTLINQITIGYGFTSALQQAFLGFLIILLMMSYGRTQHIRLRM
jgi:ribose transport system permease protein